MTPIEKSNLNCTAISATAQLSSCCIVPTGSCRVLWTSPTVPCIQQSYV